MMEICRTLVMLLHIGDIFTESLMEFIKVCYKIPSPSRRNVSLGVYRDGRIIVFIDIEWRDTSGSMQSIVVCKLHEWEK